MSSILITGAAKGFGNELFRVYSERKWKIFPLVRNRRSAEKLLREENRLCFPILGDVASDDIENIIRNTLKNRTDSLDILINNAGSIKKNRGIQNTRTKDMEDHFRVHCVGAFHCTRAVLPFLKKASKPVIVNISSRWGSIFRTLSGMGGGIYSYQIAKCAQNMLSATLDQELTPLGIRVFSVHPGRLKTSVGAPDADVLPRDAALRLADWIESTDRTTVCGCHDLMDGGLIEW
jgi:NAD(P)-dependent dehydrogenase (short-subunit alcohol dehydrogenase family)